MEQTTRKPHSSTQHGNSQGRYVGLDMNQNTYVLETSLKDTNLSTHPFVASEVAIGIAHTTNGHSRSNWRSSTRNHQFNHFATHPNHTIVMNRDSYRNPQKNVSLHYGCYTWSVARSMFILCRRSRHVLRGTAFAHVFSIRCRSE